MANPFKKLFDWLKKIFTRPGLQPFLAQYLALAVEVVTELAKVNNNAEFHAYRDVAFSKLKKLLGETKDTWIVILVHLAYEEYKARQPKQ